MFEKYMGVVLIGVVLYYVFLNAQQTGDLVASVADANAKGIAALQGRPTAASTVRG